jgi:hypothetical protein
MPSPYDYARERAFIKAECQKVPSHSLCPDRTIFRRVKGGTEESKAGFLASS